MLYNEYPVYKIKGDAVSEHVGKLVIETYVMAETIERAAKVYSAKYPGYRITDIKFLEYGLTEVLPEELK